ncbi:MAG: DNA gyrase C-terminal beta-propeller domain-containing protein, partial [Nitriliruptoraceae bacterium]
ARQRGTHTAGVLGGSGPQAPLAGAVVLPREHDDRTLVTVSALGQVKRTELSEFVDARQRSLVAAGVRDGDGIVAVSVAGDDDHLLLANDAGLVTRFPVTEVRRMGRSATGVAGMNLPEGARLVSATVLPSGTDDAEVITVDADGRAKRAAVTEYPPKSRGTKGVKTGDHATLRFCGVAGDLHVGTEPPSVVRPVDVAQGRRAGAMTTELGAGAVTGPVIVEHVAIADN